MNNIERVFIPGSEWLYLKIYTGIKNADQILIEQTSSWINYLTNKQIISNYFFIRYYDPDFHIRLRVKLTSCKAFTEVLQQFYTFFSKPTINGLTWKIQCDTYKREIERYGENTIEICESIFCIDSESQIQLFKKINHSNNADRYRWLFALQIIDQYLNIQKFDNTYKSVFISNLSENFCNEFGFTNSNRLKQLNDKFRTNREIIETTLQKGHDFSHDLLEWRQKHLTPLFQTLEAQQIKNQGHISIKEITSSLIHMSMNRLFRSNNRLCEMIIYYYLKKYYKSEIAKYQQKLNS